MKNKKSQPLSVAAPAPRHLTCTQGIGNLGRCSSDDKFCCTAGSEYSGPCECAHCHRPAAPEEAPRPTVCSKCGFSLDKDASTGELNCFNCGFLAVPAAPVAVPAQELEYGYCKVHDARHGECQFAPVLKAEAPTPLPPQEPTVCIGTFWTDKEIAAIEDLAKRQELSHAAVIRQGLRLYQMHVLGVPDLGDKASPELAAALAGETRTPCLHCLNPTCTCPRGETALPIGETPQEVPLEVWHKIYGELAKELTFSVNTLGLVMDGTGDDFYGNPATNWHVFELWKKLGAERLRAETTEAALTQAQQDVKDAQFLRNEAKAETERWRNENRVSIGEVWHWQGDDEDKVESLTCPILITPEQMKPLLATHTEVTKLIEALEPFANEYENRVNGADWENASNVYNELRKKKEYENKPNI